MVNCTLENLCNNLMDVILNENLNISYGLRKRNLTKSDKSDIENKYKNIFEKLYLVYNDHDRIKKLFDSFDEFIGHIAEKSFGIQYNSKFNAEHEEIKIRYNELKTKRGNLNNHIKRLNPTFDILSSTSLTFSNKEKYRLNKALCANLDELTDLEKKLKDMEKIIDKDFIGKIDVFLLFDQLFNNYKEKYEKVYSRFNLSQHNNLPKNMDIGNRKIRITAYFNEDFVTNTYNHYNKSICLSNNGKYFHASLLHSVHPGIHYLNLISPDLENNPICTAILVECLDINHEKYLVIEGIIENFDNLNGIESSIYPILWNKVKEFSFLQDYKNILVNKNHSPNHLTSYKFIKEINLNQKKLEEKEIYLSLIPHIVNQKKFIEIITNKNGKGQAVCRNDLQYLEMFLGKNETKIFHETNGTVSGFYINIEKTISLESEIASRAVYPCSKCILFD